MPYSGRPVKKADEKDTNKILKIKASKLQEKNATNIQDEGSSSSFSIEENRVYTIKKKNQSKVPKVKKGKKKIELPKAVNEPMENVAMSMSDDSFAF